MERWCKHMVHGLEPPPPDERCVVCEGGRDGICGHCQSRGYDLWGDCGCYVTPEGRRMCCDVHRHEEEAMEAWFDYNQMMDNTLWGPV